MSNVLAILIALCVFFGFVGLTAFERARGRRLFARARALLDARVSRGIASLRTADPLSYLIRGAHTLFGHVFHDIAIVTLSAVRLLERSLASLVRRLGLMRHASAPRTETNSSFVKSISFHKRTLRQPEAPSEERTEDTVG